LIHEIYSFLLPAEVPRDWKIAAWTIAQQTRTFPNVGGVHNVRQCVSVPRDQESVYLPLIENYVAVNDRKRTLERN
jgi:hypothetical protein